MNTADAAKHNFSFTIIVGFPSLCQISQEEFQNVRLNQMPWLCKRKGKYYFRDGAYSNVASSLFFSTTPDFLFCLFPLSSNCSESQFLSSSYYRRQQRDTENPNSQLGFIAVLVFAPYKWWPSPLQRSSPGIPCSKWEEEIFTSGGHLNLKNLDVSPFEI